MVDLADLMKMVFTEDTALFTVERVSEEWTRARAGAGNLRGISSATAGGGVGGGGMWTESETAELIVLTKQYGVGKWSRVTHWTFFSSTSRLMYSTRMTKAER